MSYGKSSLLERGIRALVREQAGGLLFEERDPSTYTKLPANAAVEAVSQDKIHKPLLVGDYIFFTRGRFGIQEIKYFKKGTFPRSFSVLMAFRSVDEDEHWELSKILQVYLGGGIIPATLEEWNQKVREINSAPAGAQEAAEKYIKEESAKQGKPFWMWDFLDLPPEKSSTPASNESLKQVQKLLKLTPDGVWGKQTEAAWEGFITVARGKVPGLPADIVTNWKAAAPKVKVNGATFKPDYTGMLSFMKAVKEIPDPGGSAVA